MLEFFQENMGLCVAVGSLVTAGLAMGGKIILEMYQNEKKTGYMTNYRDLKKKQEKLYRVRKAAEFNPGVL